VVEALPKVMIPDLSRVVLILLPSEMEIPLPVPELEIVRTSPEPEA